MSSLTIFRGRTWQRRLTVLDRNTGLAVPIAGATIEFRVKRFTSDPDPALIALGVGAGITILNGGAGGQALLEVLGSASLAIPEDVYIGSVIVTLNGETLPHIVVPPFKLPIRTLP